MSSIRERFEAEMPGHFFLSEEVDQVETYLIEQRVMPRKRLMKKGATIDRIEPLALGEMDFAIRVHFGEGLQPHGPTVILKQARPWIEQRPGIKAPVSRSRAEAGYLKMMSRVPALAVASPNLIHHDMGNHVMVMHDFGAGSDMKALYTGDSIEREVNDGEDLVTALVGYLNTLHAHFLLNPPVRPVVNKGMRKLNHERLFIEPFKEIPQSEDPRATPGTIASATSAGLLASLGNKTAEPAIFKRVEELGARFLDFKAGGTLLHGDFRPSNFWVGSDARKTLRIIEPSSCLSGPPEFDFGIFVAHLHLSGNAAVVDSARGLYTGNLDEQLWRGYAGVELMRRLSEEVQISLVAVDRDVLLDTAKDFILN